MKYKNIYEAEFLKRPNRFIAEVLIDGELEKVHVKNTGRCKEILLPQTKVYLEKSNNPKRKTRYSLISAYKDQVLINLDSQVPNKVVYDGLINQEIEYFLDLDLVKREVSYKNSRFDIYYEKNNRKGFIEVKGVTLEKNGLAMFPDAPTERGRKHILELIDALEDGYEASIFFLIQIDDIEKFTAHEERDPEFARLLKLAKSKGVNIFAYNSKVTKDTISINKEIQLII